MKRNYIIHGMILLCLFASIYSCSKESTFIPEPEISTNKLIGKWEMYRIEVLETIIDEWTGTEWTTKDMWFTYKRTDACIIMDFKENGTVDAKYVDVLFNSGRWVRIEENRFRIAFDPTNSLTAESDNERKSTATFYCDNTISIISESNPKNIS